MNADFRIIEQKISAESYQKIRATTGWEMLEMEIVEKALKHDLFSVTVFADEKLIGIGRVIGDGAIYFYIQDIIVIPEYKKQGIGTLIMNRIETFLENNAPHNSFVGLMSAAGVEAFYKRFGYQRRPESRPGMYKIIKHEAF